MTRLLLITTFIFLLSSCKQESKVERSLANVGGCHSGNWANNQLPLTLSIGNDLQAYLTTAYPTEPNIMEIMAQEWSSQLNASKGLINPTMLIENDKKSFQSRDYRDSTLGLYKSDTWFSEFGSNALAVTQYFVNPSTGNVVHADIFFNFKDFGSGFSKTGPGFRYDLGTIALHELGHLLGICHVEGVESVMNPNYYKEQRDLYLYDSALIQNKYAHIVDYQSQALSSGKQNAIGVVRKPTKAELDNEIRAIIELNANGDCNHYVDGVLVEHHKVDLDKLK